jgi:hypothetical protein
MYLRHFLYDCDNTCKPYFINRITITTIVEHYDILMFGIFIDRSNFPSKIEVIPPVRYEVVINTNLTP